MAAIRQLDTPQNLGLQPTEIGVESTAAAARRGGAFFNQAAQDITGLGHEVGSTINDVGKVALEYENHREISAGQKDLAARINNLTETWNNTVKNADPNDPSVAAKFREEVLEPELESFAGNFHTEAAQNWAQTHVGQLRQHMFEKTAADMSTMAGQAARVNHVQTVNFLSNTAMNDPSSLDFALKTLEGSTAASIDANPNLKGTVATGLKAELTEKGREQIVKSAAIGQIMKTGEVPSWVTDPKYSKYINGAELKQLAQTANYYKRLDESERRSQRVEQERQQKNDLNGKLNDIEREMLPQKPGDEPKVPADVYDRLRQLYIHSGAAFDRSAIESTVRKAEAVDARVNKPEPLTRVSHETTMGLMKRIRATDDSRLTDNSEIYKAYERGDLNRADLGFLVSEFNNIRTPDGAALEKDRGNFVKSYARLIDGMMNQAGEHSLLGTQKMYEFEMDARRQEAQLRKEGKDPHLVYDPRSPEFWGRPENIARYRVSLQEAQKYEKTLKAMDEEAAKASPATGFAAPSNWQWSPSRRQYRDPDGKVYDAKGQPVKP